MVLTEGVGLGSSPDSSLLTEMNILFDFGQMYGCYQDQKQW